MKAKAYGVAGVLLAAVLCVGCGQATLGENTQQSSQSGSMQESSSQVEPGSEAEGTSESESVTETESEIETETEQVPVVSTVTITAVGDCALGALQYHGYEASFHQYYDKYGESYFFEKFQDIFEGDDLTIANLECVFTDEENRVDKKFNIKGKPEYTGIMTSNSVEAVSLGNNHSSDYGPESLKDTQEALDKAGILYAYNDIISYFTTEEGLVVGMVSASVLSSETANDQYLLNGVKKAREEGADLVIALCHWGIEGDNYPNTFQQELGHKLIDAGADLVVGNHPHVLQGVEEYKGKIICYSLGNFSFGANRNPNDKNTAVYQQTFTFVDGVLQTDIQAKMIPTRLSGLNNKNNYQPILAEGEQAQSIIKKLNEYSSKYSGVSFDEEGILIIAEE